MADKHNHLRELLDPTISNSFSRQALEELLRDKDFTDAFLNRANDIQKHIEKEKRINKEFYEKKEQDNTRFFSILVGVTIEKIMACKFFLHEMQKLAQEEQQILARQVDIEHEQKQAVIQQETDNIIKADNAAIALNTIQDKITSVLSLLEQLKSLDNQLQQVNNKIDDWKEKVYEPEMTDVAKQITEALPNPILEFNDQFSPSDVKSLQNAWQLTQERIIERLIHRATDHEIIMHIPYLQLLAEARVINSAKITGNNISIITIGPFNEKTEQVKNEMSHILDRTKRLGTEVIVSVGMIDFYKTLDKLFRDHLNISLEKKTGLSAIRHGVKYPMNPAVKMAIKNYHARMTQLNQDLNDKMKEPLAAKEHLEQEKQQLEKELLSMVTHIQTLSQESSNPALEVEASKVATVITSRSESKDIYLPQENIPEAPPMSPIEDDNLSSNRKRPGS